MIYENVNRIRAKRDHKLFIGDFDVQFLEQRDVQSSFCSGRYVRPQRERTDGNRKTNDTGTACVSGDCARRSQNMLALKIYALSAGTQLTLALPHACHCTLNASAFMQKSVSALDHCDS